MFKNIVAHFCDRIMILQLSTCIDLQVVFCSIALYTCMILSRNLEEEIIWMKENLKKNNFEKLIKILVKSTMINPKIMVLKLKKLSFRLLQTLELKNCQET